MSELHNTKYGRDVIESYGSLINAMNNKTFKEWYLEHMERISIAALIMEELGINGNIFELHDADIINGKRIKTFADFLNNYNVSIVSKNLESGNIDNVNIIQNNLPFGGLSEYVTKKDFTKNNKMPVNELSYNFIDTIIFDDYKERIEKYISTALGLGIECFIPIIGYKDSLNSKREIEKAEMVKQYVSSIEGCCIKEKLYSPKKNDNSFVKVIKISKK